MSKILIIDDDDSNRVARSLREQDRLWSGAFNRGIETVDGNGEVTGAFSNGQQRLLGQVAVARFRDNDGLVRGGDALYSASLASGAALVGPAGSAGRGVIVAGALEQSTVDLGQQFVNLIAYERGFQANSRTVTTANTMLDDVLNMVR